MTSAPLLFLGHATDRTGPPIYLLHFLRWLRANQPSVDFEVAALTGGELEEEFRDLAPLTIYEGVPAGLLERFERRWHRHHVDVPESWFVERRARVLRRQMRQHIDAKVVYVSAAPSIELARALPPADRVQLAHVHELEIGLTYRCSAADRHRLLAGSEQIFVPAEAVARNLVERHGVDRAVIAHHSETVDIAAIESAPTAADRRAGRQARGLSPDGSVVAASGTLDWRKGVDHFLRAAHLVNRSTASPPVTFVWIGGSPNDVARAEQAASDWGVRDVVRFVGSQPDPVEWFRLIDVLLLTSREDPFPLVCLEAAAVGVPIVAFDTGGMPELLVKGCGRVASYPDVEELAQLVVELVDDPTTRAVLGARGGELVRAENDVAVLAPRLWADIERWMP